jgi:Rab GDP dissociation inhibitor
MDRNDYYGGDTASLTLKQLLQHAATRAGEDPAAVTIPSELGNPRDWSIDVIPKFILSNGALVKMLVRTNVTHYLDFKVVDGSYVFDAVKGVQKVPATAKDAIASKLMNLMEKRRMKNLLELVAEHESAKVTEKYDLEHMTMAELYDAFKLSDSTRAFLGHAMALHRTDEYLTQPAIETVKRLMLYCVSLSRFGSSPYIYPLCGLGDLSQAFARLSAVCNGVYMLRRGPDSFEFNEDGSIKGIVSNGERAGCKWLLGDPSYFCDREMFAGAVKKTGRVVRAICLMKTQPAGTLGTSAQIIVPAASVGRQTDMYVSCQGYGHQTSPKDRALGLVSTTVETDEPEAELAHGLRLLGEAEGNILRKFVFVNDTYSPVRGVESFEKRGVFVSESYDATSHFETTVADVLGLFTRITGKEIDLSVDTVIKHPSTLAAEAEEAAADEE